jgi:hypothetical protein
MFDADETPTPTDSAADRAERHGRVLQELTELGMNLARAVSAEATVADPAKANELALAFSRIARAVRQTLALAAKLAEERQATAAERVRRDDLEAGTSALNRRLRIERLVERAIDAEASDDEAEGLYDDLRERLEDTDDLAGFHDRPLPEIVALICKDLGVTPPKIHWTDTDWGMEERSSPEAAGGVEPLRIPRHDERPGFVHPP